MVDGLYAGNSHDPISLERSECVSQLRIVDIKLIMISLQDTLISFEEFVQIMDASDVEHKMSMKFVG